MSTLNVEVTHGNWTHDLQSRMVLVEPFSQGGAKILGGSGTHPLTFFGAGLSILMFF